MRSALCPLPPCPSAPPTGPCQGSLAFLYMMPPPTDFRGLFRGDPRARAAYAEQGPESTGSFPRPLPFRSTSRRPPGPGALGGNGEPGCAGAARRREFDGRRRHR